MDELCGEERSAEVVAGRLLTADDEGRFGFRSARRTRTSSSRHPVTGR